MAVQAATLLKENDMRRPLISLLFVSLLWVMVEAEISDPSIAERFHSIWDIDKGLQEKSDSLFEKGMAAYGNKDYKEAIRFFSDSKKIDDKIYHNDNYRSSYSSHWLAESMALTGDSAGYLQNIGGSAGKPIDRKLTIESDSLGILAIVWAEKDINETLRLLKESASIERKVLGTDHPMYANTLMLLGNIYLNLDSINEAINAVTDATEIRRNYYGEKNEAYAASASLLALALHMKEDYESIKKSVDLRYPLIEIYKATGNKEEELNAYYFLVNDYLSLGTLATDPQQKETYLLEGLALLEPASEAFDIMQLKGSYLNSLGNLYSNLAIMKIQESGSADDKIKLNKKALQYYRECKPYGINPMSATAALLRLAYAYEEAGAYRDAITCFEECLSEMRAYRAEAGLNIIYPLQHLAIQYSEHSEPTKAIPLLEEAIDIMESSQGTNPVELAMLYLTKSKISASLGDIEDALASLTRGDQLIGSYNINNTPMEFTYLSLRSETLYLLGLESEYLRDIERLCSICNEIYPGDQRIKNQLWGKLVQAQINYGIPDWENNYEEKEEILTSIPDANAYEYSNHYSLGAHGYMKDSQYDKAGDLIDKAITLYSPSRDANDDLLVHFYLKKAEIALHKKNYDEGLALSDYILSIPDVSALNKQQAYSIKATAYSGMEQFEKAIENESEGLRYNIEIKGEDSSSSLNIKSSIALYNEMLHNYDEAYRIRKEVAEKWHSISGEDSESYLAAVVAMEGVPHYGNGNRKKEAQLKLLDRVAETHGKNSLSYYYQLLNTARIFVQMALFDEAKEYGEKGLAGYLELKGERNEIYEDNLMSSIGWYLYSNDYETALQRADQAIELTEKYYPKAWIRLINGLKWRQKIHEAAFDWGSALYEVSKMEQLALQRGGETSAQYLDALNEKAILMNKSGDYDRSVDVATELLKKASASSVAYIKEELTETALNDLLLGNALRGDIKSTKEIISQIEEMNFNRNNKILFHNLAYANYITGDTAKALEMSNALLSDDVLKKADSENQANILVKQGLIHVMSGEIDKGKSLMEKGMHIRDSIYNGEGYYMALGLRDMITLSELTGDTESRTKYALQLSDVTSNYIKKSFLTMPASSREKLWARFSPFILNDFPAIAEEDPSEATLSKAYDNLLLGKGLLLNTEREISDIISDISDQEIQRKYDEYKGNRSVLDYLSTVDKSQIAVNVDSLKQLTTQLEYELLGYCGDFTEALETNWREIKDALLPGEAAIEFANLTDEPNHYIALIVKNDSSNPEMVSYKDINIDRLWTRSPHQLSKELWGPLSDMLGNVSKVYFSAAGELHSHPVEYLPDFEDSDSWISDRWNVQRISSTRELLKRNKRRSPSMAAVFGGLRYDANPVNENKVSNGNSKNKNREMKLDFSELSDSTLRSGADYLPASLEEAETINESLTNRGIKTYIYTDTLGTETIFKDLSGSDCNILHVATHGFTLDEKDASKYNRVKFLNFDDNISMGTDDKALTRSGLLFTGANRALKGQDIPEGTDDGILLAKEIALLDLSNVDMVILSACETGLGEIKGEGVFGLQRGFKKAGVNSLVMSLWKVDDTATRMLMTKFYELYLSGSSKYDALKKAQNFVRNYEEEIAVEDEDNMTASQRRRNKLNNDEDEIEAKTIKVNPYSDPKYWAAFVLLDAID